MGRLERRKKREREKKLAAKAQRTRVHTANEEARRPRDILEYGRAITRRQFDALCFSRMPLVRFIAEELEWYSLFENRLLAIIMRDVTDDDFGFIVLGRDARRLFRCIDVGARFFRSVAEARDALAKHLHTHYEGKVRAVYPQGDEVASTIELFRDVIPVEKQHRNYRILASEPRYEAARNLISEIANSFSDNDGHYEREFQSSNFQARLWELYLHIYFHNAGLLRENNHVAPDFELSCPGGKVFVEAVTVNPSESKDRPDLPAPESVEEIEERLNDFMPIKFGSSIYSKTQKQYWLHSHVKGFPLVIAVHDYHNEDAMTWSRTALSEYLYGVRVRMVNGESTTTKIESHEWAGKRIASGMFFQPEYAHISAVLFSNQATIPKFNRMGKLGGLGSANVKMIRRGFLYNPDPNATYPIPFAKDLDDPDYEESWSDGLIVFHNPNAVVPLSPDVFSDISHIRYSEKDGFTGYHQPYDVLGSVTIVVTTREEK